MVFLDRRRRVSAAALLVFASLTASAQAQQYSFRFFGTQDGLSNLAVKVLFQDRIGFLWAATENGVFRYDGTRFRRFGPEDGLPRDLILSLGEAPDGSVLAGGRRGLYRLAGSRFERVELPRGAVVESYNSIRYDGHGRTYIATNQGLMVGRQEPSLVLQFLPGGPGTTLTPAHGLYLEKDSLWYGCGPGLCRLGPGGTTVFGMAEGLPAGQWICIRRDAAGDLWVSDKHRFAVQRRGQATLQTKALGLPPPAGSGQFEVDGDGRLMVPTTAGLAIQRPDGWRLIGKRENLRAPVYSVLQDREGSVWLGLAGRGLARWEGYGLWEGFAPESGLDSELIYEVAPLGKDAVWAGTETGLFLGHRKGVRWTWERDARVGKIPVHAVRLAPDGSLWLGTEGFGAIRRDPHGRTEWIGQKQGLLGHSPYALAVDREGIWAGTEAGLFVKQAGENRFRRVPEVPAIRCWSIAVGYPQEIVVGTTQGLYWGKHGTWRHLSVDDGLLHSTVLAVAARAGEIWAGYWFTGGITRITTGGSRLVFTHFGPSPGVVGNMTYFLGFDARGGVWSGSDQGVRTWDGARWRQYDQSDGLIWNDCDLGAFAAGADGSVWIGTSNGLAHFTNKDQPEQPPPAVVLTELRLGNQDVAGRPAVQAGSRDNALFVQYAALTFSRDASLIFRYRLPPISNQWVETAMRELTLPALQPEQYRLELQARAGRQEWSATTAFPFVIRPPWWATWWCRALAAATALGGIAALWRWRIYALTARQRELEAIVADRTRQLREQAIKDGLTGLLNRSAFFEVLERELARARREGDRLALVMLDLDHFKSINDTHGHQAGDAVLKETAQRILQSVRSYDTVGRYGGEELAILMPGCGLEAASGRAESVRGQIAELPFATPAGTVNVTASFGVTVTGPGCEGIHELLQAADQALYAAKANGRNCVVGGSSPAAQGEETAESFAPDLSVR